MGEQRSTPASIVTAYRLPGMTRFFTLLALTALLTACPEKKPADANQAPAAAKPATPQTAAPATPAKPASTAVLASGTLTLAPGAKADAAKGLFVSLRSPAVRGPPIAAMKMPPGPFPLKFVLTEANIVAMGGKARPVPAEFALKATLDMDGNPMSKSPDDLVVVQTVKKGSTDLQLILAPAK
jgi:hypothetical protein